MSGRIDRFDGVYFGDSVLPSDFTSRLDVEVIEAFKQGKKFIFHDLEENFSSIYNFLMTEMSELVVVRQDGGSAPFYHWALLNDNFNIYGSVSKTFRKVKLKRSEKDFYEALPHYLQAFYYFFDGFDFTDEKRLSLHESGFLLSFSNWYNMSDIIEYSAIGDVGNEDFINKFCRSDIRIILRQKSGKVAFIDKTKTLEGVWAGVWGELGRAEKLENPIKYFNDCFFEAVNSFN